jgi:predicted aspartyl protease
MSNFPYATTYEPPAPVCTVSLVVSATGHRVEVDALIDTGADATIIPMRYLRDIGARRAFAARLRS